MESRLRLFLLVSLASLVACHPTQSEPPGPIAIAPKAGMGVIHGKLEPIPALWDGIMIFAFAATYLGPPGGEGAFVLDANFHPKGQLDSQGWFQIPDIAPGSYVLVFGPDPDNALAFRKDGKAVRFQVVSGQIVDVGTISISP